MSKKGKGSRGGGQHDWTKGVKQEIRGRDFQQKLYLTSCTLGTKSSPKKGEEVPRGKIPRDLMKCIKNDPLRLTLLGLAFEKPMF